MSPAYLLAFDARNYDLHTDDRRIPVPPGEEQSPVQEPPDEPGAQPKAPVYEPEPEEPQRLRNAA